MAKEEEEGEPASPNARMLHAKELNMCIIVVLGFKTMVDPILCKKTMEQTLLKHPRFSCILVEKKGKCWWKRTHVDAENHLFFPHLDPDMEHSDEFVEDFTSNLSKIPLDMTKPPWEFHILNVKTSDAESVVIFKLHHALGDGVSLISVLLACSRKVSDPKSLPVMPLSKKQKHVSNRGWMIRLFVMVWTFLLVIFYTLVDVAMNIATLMFFKDGGTPIKVSRGAELTCKRFVHRIVNLDDVKLVKRAMNVSINDVLVGVTEAGLSRYINTRFEKVGENIIGRKIIKKSFNSLQRKLRLRSIVVFNLRPTPTIENMFEMMEKGELNGMWGNAFGLVLLPFTISPQDDVLTHIRRAKSTLDRKKLSLGHKIVFLSTKIIMSLFGTKSAAKVLRTMLENTTLTFSNVMGPQEEILLGGHQLAYIAPSLYNFPQSLTVHYQSYAGKLIISIGVDEKIIPNPRQLCDDLVKSLEDIKNAVIKRGLLNDVDHN